MTSPLIPFCLVSERDCIMVQKSGELYLWQSTLWRQWSNLKRRNQGVTAQNWSPIGSFTWLTEGRQESPCDWMDESDKQKYLYCHKNKTKCFITQIKTTLESFSVTYYMKKYIFINSEYILNTHGWNIVHI